MVLPPGLDFTVVFSGVGQQQVTDEKGGVPAEVLSSEGQTAGLSACGLIGVHLSSEESDDLDAFFLKKE